MVGVPKNFFYANEGPSLAEIQRVVNPSATLTTYAPGSAVAVGAMSTDQESLDDLMLSFGFLPTTFQQDITIYAASTGDDNNVGSLASPVHSLDRALALLPPVHTGKCWIVCLDNVSQLAPTLTVYPSIPVGPKAEPVCIINGAAASGGSPFSDSGLGTRAVSSTSGLTVADNTIATGKDAWGGARLRFLTGGQSGNSFFVLRNTTTGSFALGGVGAPSPAILPGDQFVIEVPTNTLTLNTLIVQMGVLAIYAMNVAGTKIDLQNSILFADSMISAAPISAIGPRSVVSFMPLRSTTLVASGPCACMTSIGSTAFVWGAAMNAAINASNGAVMFGVFSCRGGAASGTVLNANSIGNFLCLYLAGRLTVSENSYLDIEGLGGNSRVDATTGSGIGIIVYYGSRATLGLVGSVDVTGSSSIGIAIRDRALVKMTAVTSSTPNGAFGIETDTGGAAVIDATTSVSGATSDTSIGHLGATTYATIRSSPNKTIADSGANSAGDWIQSG